MLFLNVLGAVGGQTAVGAADRLEPELRLVLLIGWCGGGVVFKGLNCAEKPIVGMGATRLATGEQEADVLQDTLPVGIAVARVLHHQAVKQPRERRR